MQYAGRVGILNGYLKANWKLFGPHSVWATLHLLPKKGKHLSFGTFGLQRATINTNPPNSCAYRRGVRGGRGHAVAIWNLWQCRTITYNCQKLAQCKRPKHDQVAKTKALKKCLRFKCWLLLLFLLLLLLLLLSACSVFCAACSMFKLKFNSCNLRGVEGVPCRLVGQRPHAQLNIINTPHKPNKCESLLCRQRRRCLFCCCRCCCCAVVLHFLWLWPHCNDH